MRSEEEIREMICDLQSQIKQCDNVIPTNGTSAEDIKYANTVKKVYIDGVDVNKCGYYKDGDCLLSPVTCEEFIDCDFKEIKRLQAENEWLKEENYGLNQELLGYKKGVQASEIIELKQALQEIREYCEEQNLKADYTACEILAKINEVIGVEE